MGNTDVKEPFLFAVSGYKNTGKTTLITALIPLLKDKGYRVATIKHDGHDFAPDVPGTDSFRHCEAGAYGTAVFSDKRLMVVRECRNMTAERLAEAFPEADIILLEGFKNRGYPGVCCKYPEEIPDAEQIVEKIAALLADRHNL